MKWLASRLTEASTWAGFAALIPSLFAVVVNKNDASAYGTLAAGVAAVLIPEGKK